MQNPQSTNPSGALVLLVGLLIFMTLFGDKIFSKMSRICARASYYALAPLSFLEKPQKIREILENTPDNVIETYPPSFFLSFVGSYYRFVFLPVGCLIIWLCVKRDPGGIFRRKFTMWTLLQHNSQTFPCLLPILKSGPITQKPIATGPWALAESPILFSANHLLLLKCHDLPYVKEDLVDPKTGLARPDSPALGQANQFDDSFARRILVKQLGKIFEGSILDLPLPERAMAAAFLAHLNDQKNEAYQIFDTLSASWDPETLTIEAPLAEKVAERYQNFQHPELTKHQSYVNVWFMALLKLAREKGTLPSSLWIWLKPTHRTLFYALNQMGGRAAWSEAAGAFSHFIAEKRAGHTLFEPMVESALVSLKESLRREGWLPRLSKYDSSNPERRFFETPHIINETKLMDPVKNRGNLGNFPREPIKKPDEPIRKPDEPIRKSDEPIRNPDEPIRKSDEPIRKRSQSNSELVDILKKSLEFLGQNVTDDFNYETFRKEGKFGPDPLDIRFVKPRELFREKQNLPDISDLEKSKNPDLKNLPHRKDVKKTAQTLQKILKSQDDELEVKKCQKMKKCQKRKK
ncbi:MAG: hypothetical protein LBF22_14905 [Deltaproteobacteria bacterium]|nr:hypothetical protein [Deltaproteobacteria bacterium]